MTTTRTVLQLVSMNETGDSYYRMRWPARDLALQSPELRVINLEATARERLSWAEEADLLVLFQSMDYDLLPVVERRRKAGRKTLVEYNDNFYEPQPWSPVAREWSSPRLWYTYETFMRESDGILVTGPGLRELFGDRFGKPVHVLPNHLPDPVEGLDTLLREKTPYLSLGWAGSLGHIADIFALAPVVKKLLDRVPGMKFHVMGNESIPGHLGIPADRVEFTPWGTMHQYYLFWERVHIGVAPLLDTPYNRCRSDIKAVEMASRGVLPLLASALPYEEFLRTISMRGFSTLSEFEEMFLAYADKKDKRLADMSRCHDYVAAKRIGVTEQARKDLYRSLLEGSPSSTFTWPVGPGYHEVKGTHHPYLLSASVTNQIQSHITRKEFAKAKKLASDLRLEQHLNPEAWLVELRFLRLSDRKGFEEKLDEAIKLFSHDLRFDLLRVESLEGEGEKRAAWGRVLDRLEAHGEKVRIYYGPEIIAYAVAAIPKAPHLVEIAERILATYPSASNLRYVVAELLEKAGEYGRALLHFETLLREKESSLLGGKFLEGLEMSYLEAWRATLRARIHDGQA